MNFFRRFSVWLREVIVGPQWFSHAAIEDSPDELEPQCVYLVGEDGQYWSAAFLCPCGCKAVIQLSLIPDDKPRWRATLKGKKLTLHPSVWRNTGCRSHFFIRDGRVIWAR